MQWHHHHEQASRWMTAVVVLAFAWCGSGCGDADAKAALATPMNSAPAITSVTDQPPQAPFDNTLITPVESAGASRFES